MMNNTNLSFGTFRIISQGCEPIQKDFIDVFTNSFVKIPEVKILNDGKTDDVFVKIKPNSKNCCDELDAARAERFLAKMITKETGIKTKIDISKSDKSGELEYVNVPQNLKKGLENLKDFKVGFLVSHIKDCYNNLSREEFGFKPSRPSKTGQIIKLSDK